MVRDEAQALESLDECGGQFVIVMAPDYHCCECDEQLKPGLCGLLTMLLPMPFRCVFLVCGIACQRAGFLKLLGDGKQVYLVSAAEVRLLMDRGDRIAGYAQIRHCGPTAIMEPFKMKGDLVQDTLFSPVRRWTN
jgi:hypothetical protein